MGENLKMNHFKYCTIKGKDFDVITILLKWKNFLNSSCSFVGI